MKYTDSDGRNFELVQGLPRTPGQPACLGCAMATSSGTGGTSKCRTAPSCTPSIGPGQRLTGAGMEWVEVELPLFQ